MSSKLVIEYNQQSILAKFDKLPIRIFLDTNVVQYINSFGEYIYENYMEHEDCFIGSHGKKTKRGDFLFVQILALRQIFFAVERTPFEFAISVNVYEEIQRKNDFRLTQWFYDLWDYWQTVIWDQNGKAFTGQGKISALRLQQDDSIKNALSKPDFKIFTDAIELECDAILTCDKYRSRQDWIYKNYGIMVLFPSDLCELTKDFHSLWY